MSMFYELMMKKKGMPSRYQEVEYIESTGTQYINTNIIPKVTFKYKIKYSLNATGNQVLFGTRTSGAFDTSRNQIYLNANNNSLEGAKTYLLNIYGVNNFNLDIVPTQNVIVETSIMQNENCIIENATQPIYLFALNNKGVGAVFAKTKMYYYQIYDNTTLIRNFIPVYDTETQKYGMWESVQRKFYGNDGTGDFGGSIVGYTVVGSPTISDGVVTDLSSSNYLTLPSVDLSSASSFEFDIAFTTNATNSANWNAYIMTFNDGKARYFGTQYQKKLTFITINTSLDGNTILNNSTFYIAKYIFNRLNNVLNLKILLEDSNENVITDGSFTDVIDITTTNTIKLGTGGTNQNMVSIDLNKTKFYKNKKLFFNGQQS